MGISRSVDGVAASLCCFDGMFLASAAGPGLHVLWVPRGVSLPGALGPGFLLGLLVLAVAAEGPPLYLDVS